MKRTFKLIGVILLIALITSQSMKAFFQKDLWKPYYGLLLADKEEEKPPLPPPPPPVGHGPIPQDSIIYQPDGAIIIIYQ